MNTIPNLTTVYDVLSNFANLDSFWNRLNNIFGTQYNVTIAQSIRSQWKAKNFSQLPKIEIVSSNILGDAQAAYSQTVNKIYLSQSFLNSATPSALNAVLLEEIGHYVDAKINQNDTRGDEGELFSNVVRNINLSTSDLTRIQNEDDWGKITVNGQIITVEKSTPILYETVKILSVNSSLYNTEYSGSNFLFVTNKRSNTILNFFDGTKVTPITNLVYRSFDGFDISGNTSVYGKMGEIYKYSAGITTRLTNNNVHDYEPLIDGNNIVWYSYEGGDVEIFRNNGTTTTQLTNNTTDEYDLQISGNNTFWVGWDGNDAEVYFNNGTTTKQISNNTFDDYSPIVSGNKAVWARWNGQQEDLLYFDGVTTLVAATNVNLNSYNNSYKISGDKVVYVNNGILKLYNGTTKTTTTLSTNYIYDFQIDGNTVAWTEQGSNYNTVLKRYNGTSTVNIGGDSVSSSSFLLSGNKIAYFDNSSDPLSDFSREMFLYDGTTSTQVTVGMVDEYLSSYIDILAVSGSEIVWKDYSDVYVSKPTIKPVLSINNVTVVEGQTSPQNAIITVTLSQTSTKNVTVEYETINGKNDDYDSNAYSGSDYTSTYGTLTFTPGQLTQTISIPILNDSYSENDETFLVRLSNPTEAVLAPGKNHGVVTITDTLQSSATTTLSANVENLTLTGTGNINGTGNVNDNVITGNIGNNILNGGGGEDTLIGGKGNDTYIINADGYYYGRITENLNEGTDTVEYSTTSSYGSFTLPSNIERLILKGTNGISGSGNELNNTIIGNTGGNYLYGFDGNDTLNGDAGNDYLYGGIGDDTLNGGTGNDYLYGGTGNDLYIVDSVNDYISDNGMSGGIDTTTGGGIDTVQSSVTYSLSNYYAEDDDVENLTLTGSNTNHINGTGNSLNNILRGNAGNNVLSGREGKDTLTGGLGADKFDYYDDYLVSGLNDSLFSGFDVITDFNANTGNDKFLVTTARAGFNNVGAVTELTSTAIASKLTTSNFGVNFAAQFTFTSGTTTRTFVAINDEIAGFNASTDAIIEVTGLTGTLTTVNFVTT